MISCYLEGRSPEQLKTRARVDSPTAVYHLTCHQCQQFHIRYDDVVYEGAIMSKFLILGMIVSCRDGLSPTKKPIKIIRFKDATGCCSLQVF